MVAQGLRRTIASAAGSEKRQLVLGVGVLMIAAQAIFRGWALFPSWFFADDYVLLIEGKEHSAPTLPYLLDPFDIHFMPVGRLLAWVVAQSGTTNWTLAAAITLVLQVAASAACLWMLVTLFGPRWGILPLLALYVSSAITMPGLMWWAATLNQLPVQAALFLAVGCWVRHCRDRRVVSLALTLLVVLFGLLTDVRAVLIIPLLGLILLMYFVRGGLRNRIGQAVRTYPLAVVSGLGLAVAYAVFYLSFVSTPLDNTDARPLSKAREIAGSMLGTSLPSAFWGGPWHWFDTTPPIVLAGPPQMLIHLVWALGSLVIAYSLLRRTRAGRGWLLLAAYALALFVLLALSRGQVYGLLAGLEYRYLTEMACLLALCLGLVFLELKVAPESSRARTDPLLRIGVGRRWTSLLVGAIVIGALFSSWRYVEFWHDKNPSRDYVENIQSDLQSAGGTVDLPNQIVPPAVMPPYTAPQNRTDHFVPLLADNARFPTSTDDLHVIDRHGEVHKALLAVKHRSAEGPVPRCGRRITTTSSEIPLTSTTSDRRWWLRLGYIASQGTPVVVSAGDTTVHSSLRSGLHSLFVETRGRFDSVTISGLTPGTKVCLDTLEVGDPVPVEEEE